MYKKIHWVEEPPKHYLMYPTPIRPTLWLRVPKFVAVFVDRLALKVYNAFNK